MTYNSFRRVIIFAIFVAISLSHLTTGQPKIESQYIGCYHVPSNKSEDDYYYHMTVERCITYCTKRNTTFAILQNGTSCYCVDTFESSQPGNCTTPCSGNGTQYCGGRVKGVTYSSVYTACHIGYYCTSRKQSCHCMAECDHVNGGCPLGCDDSWTGQGCDTDIDECRLNACDSYSTQCQNSEGDFSCTCRRGYTSLNKTHCKDNDECTEYWTCERSTRDCFNTVGSFNCVCKNGYRPPTYSDPRGYTSCLDIDECDRRLDSCDRITTNCNNTEGSYFCTCKVGYSDLIRNRQYYVCSDIDECRLNVCDSSSTQCQNSEGDFICTCRHGYNSLNKTYCKDINECDVPNPCDELTTGCVNTPGSFVCSCKYGYKSGNSTHCMDIDECDRRRDSCDRTTTNCNNTEGSYSCTCKVGYSHLTHSRYSYMYVCRDINECDVSNPCDELTTRCINSVGSFVCECKEGYNNSGNITPCKDKVDEDTDGSNLDDRENLMTTNSNDVRFFESTNRDDPSTNGYVKSTIILGSLLSFFVLFGIIAFLIRWRFIEKSTQPGETVIRGETVKQPEETYIEIHEQATGSKEDQYEPLDIREHGLTSDYEPIRIREHVLPSDAISTQEIYNNL